MKVKPVFQFMLLDRSTYVSPAYITKLLRGYHESFFLRSKFDSCRVNLNETGSTSLSTGVFLIVVTIFEMFLMSSYKDVKCIVFLASLPYQK